MPSNALSSVFLGELLQLYKLEIGEWTASSLHLATGQTNRRTNLVARSQSVLAAVAR